MVGDPATPAGVFALTKRLAMLANTEDLEGVQWLRRIRIPTIDIRQVYKEIQDVVGHAITSPVNQTLRTSVRK